MDWEERFADIGAFWFHDGNPRRPYARLTSGKISNGFFNGEIVAEHAKILGGACDALATTDNPFHIRSSTRNYYVIGPAMGAIKFSGRVAEALDCRGVYAEKAGETFLVTRSSIPPGAQILMAEDTVSTGGSLLKMRKMLEETVHVCVIVPEIFALCNRTENANVYGDTVTIPGHRIVALVNRPMRAWEEGKNPFTPDGTELVAPIRPKGRENWEILKRDYN